MTRILVVDDDLALADVLAFTLRRAGFGVMLVHDGIGALEMVEEWQPDLIVLDWTLPRMDGLEVCRRIRVNSFVPIVMLTVRNSDDDVVMALEAGADDYVTKPFSPRQLVARIGAVLRRSGSETGEAFQAGPVSLDLDRHEMHWENRPAIHLTPLEMRLLQTLIRNADQVLTTESLIVRVWGAEGATRDMLKQLIYRLRSKIEPDSAFPTLIETVPNIGYVFNTPPKTE